MTTEAFPFSLPIWDAVDVFSDDPVVASMKLRSYLRGYGLFNYHYAKSVAPHIVEGKLPLDFFVKQARLIRNPKGRTPNEEVVRILFGVFGEERSTCIPLDSDNIPFKNGLKVRLPMNFYYFDGDVPTAVILQTRKSHYRRP